MHYYYCYDFRMYQDKLAQLKQQLQQLKNGTLPEYMKKFKKIDQQYKERLRFNEIWLNYEVPCRSKMLYSNLIFNNILIIMKKYLYGA